LNDAEAAERSLKLDIRNSVHAGYCFCIREAEFADALYVVVVQLIVAICNFLTFALSA